MTNLDGPSHPPLTGDKPTQLIVFLHGYGSNGDDLISLAPYLAPAVPEAEFLSPNAPFPCEANPFGGFQWFGLEERDAATRLAGARQAAPILDAYLDEQLAARGLGEADLALVGFSQGTMMALHVGLRRAKPVAAIIGYSGLLVAPELLAEEIRSKPPVLLVHGMADDVLPFAAMAEAEVALRAAGVPVMSEGRPGLPHSIDQRGLELGASALHQVLCRHHDHHH
ncbi:MAG: dienelactone hydrolase family protein [Rhodospirillaceae bacterium]|nr:dienelactone hydrolase family protein [Rhodospirillaceae bacterium]